jgi:hypothetical protein
MSDTLIAAITTILAALLAALLSYTHARRLQRRQARLGRLNAQLEELYGPPYATLEASRIAYRRLLDGLRPGSSSLFDPDSPPRLRKSYAYFGNGWKPSRTRERRTPTNSSSAGPTYWSRTRCPTACCSSWPKGRLRRADPAVEGWRLLRAPLSRKTPRRSALRLPPAVVHPAEAGAGP